MWNALTNTRTLARARTHTYKHTHRLLRTWRWRLQLGPFEFPREREPDGSGHHNASLRRRRHNCGLRLGTSLISSSAGISKQSARSVVMINFHFLVVDNSRRNANHLYAPSQHVPISVHGYEPGPVDGASDDETGNHRTGVRTFHMTSLHSSTS